MSLVSLSASQRTIETDSSSSSLRSHSLGFISSGLHTALSASASESTAETAVSLGDLIDRHIAARLATADAVRAWDQRTAAGEVTSVAYPNGLLDVARDEEAARLAIVNYRPRGSRESRLKLTYLAAYLFATRGTLNANEMNSILEVPRDRPSAPVS
jgi:hypothetical protein